MTAQTLSRTAGRAVTSLSRNGLRGTLQRVNRWLVAPVVGLVWMREEHIWVQVAVPEHLDPLPEGYALRRGGEADLEALAAIGGIAPHTARGYLDGGARLYVATRDEELAFATWIHVDRVPLAGAPGGWLSLPPGVVSFEDSFSAPAHRRSGIAIAAIKHVTVTEMEAGVPAPISRIDAANAPARAWAAKMGASELATVRLRRIGPFRRVRIEPLPGGEEVARLLAEQVGRR